MCVRMCGQQLLWRMRLGSRELCILGHGNSATMQSFLLIFSFINFKSRLHRHLVPHEEGKEIDVVKLANKKVIVWRVHMIKAGSVH